MLHAALAVKTYKKSKLSEEEIIIKTLLIKKKIIHMEAFHSKTKILFANFACAKNPSQE